VLQFCCIAETVSFEYVRLTSVEDVVDRPEDICAVSVESLLLDVGAGVEVLVTAS
jgi:hypothetical protein